MSTMESRPTPSEFFVSSPRVKPPVEPAAVRPAAEKKDRFAYTWSLLPLAFTRYLIAFLMGATAILAWQSYGVVARQAIAPAASFPAQSQLNAMSVDLDAVRQSIDLMATGLAASQDQMKRGVDALAAGQTWMTRDFDSKLQAVAQNILDKVSMPPPRPAPARSPVVRPAQAPMVRSNIP